MMNLVIDNNLKPLKKHEKNAINPKERGTFSLEEKTFQEVTPLFAAIICPFVSGFIRISVSCDFLSVILYFNVKNGCLM